MTDGQHSRRAALQRQSAQRLEQLREGPDSNAVRQSEARRRTKSVGSVAVVAAALVAMLLVGAWLALGQGHGSYEGFPRASASTGVRPRQVGMSVRHQRIVSYSFGGGPRRFLIVGGIHGNEYGAAVGEALVQKLQSDPRLVPPGTRFDVIPDVNPDGHLADTRGNADGVDLNRNFPTADWSPVLSAGDTSSSRGLTGGSSPGSEPETQAIIRQLQTGYEAVMTLHSRAGIVDFNGPGGASLAASVSSVIGLPVEHLPYQSQIRGSMGEFVPVKFGIPVITLELTSSQLTTRTLMGVMAIAQ